MIGTKFKNKIIFLLISLIMAISFFFIMMMNMQQKRVLNDIIVKEKDVAKDIYDYTLKALYEKYIFISENLLLDEGILRAVDEKDHQKLLVLTQHYYEKFKQDNPYLDIMHFHTPDNKSILRLHRPEVYGDDLTQLRPIIVQTNKEKKAQIGLEVGKYGIDYRVAVPINYHSKHIGVLEFGINAEYIVNILSKHYDLESILLLDEKKLTTFYDYNKKNDKPKINDYIIFSSTFFPAETVQTIENLTQGNTKQLTYFDVDHIIFKATDLLNYKDEPIGQFHLIKNIDFYTSSARKSMISLIFSVIILIIASYILTRYGFNYFIKTIDSTQKQLLQKNDELERIINIDYLTKAQNRRRIDEILSSECKRSKRYDEPLSVILFDIDNFKMINDNFGHNNGDRVLKTLAAAVSESIRDSDSFGRWGGEEFIIVTASTEIDDAVKLAQKIQTTVASTNFNELGQITCSFGVAACAQEDSVESTIHKADEALYQAKASGKNCVIKWENS